MTDRVWLGKLAFDLARAPKVFFEDEDFAKDTLGRIPMGKLGSVEDVADAVVYLASPASGMVTGSSLVVDGGWTAR